MAHLFYTHHALARMKQMELSREDVVEAIDDPEVSYPATREGDDRRCYKKGDITIVVQYPDSAEPVIVSILWNTQDTYEREPIQV